MSFGGTESGYSFATAEPPTKFGLESSNSSVGIYASDELERDSGCCKFFFEGLLVTSGDYKHDRSVESCCSGLILETEIEA